MSACTHHITSTDGILVPEGRYLTIWKVYDLYTIIVCVCVWDLQASALWGAFWFLWCLRVGGGEQDNMATGDTHWAQTNEQLHPERTHLQAAGWTGLQPHTEWRAWIGEYISGEATQQGFKKVMLIPSWWYRCRGLPSWLLLPHSARWNTAMHSYQPRTGEEIKLTGVPNKNISHCKSLCLVLRLKYVRSFSKDSLDKNNSYEHISSQVVCTSDCRIHQLTHNLIWYYWGCSLC